MNRQRVYTINKVIWRIVYVWLTLITLLIATNLVRCFAHAETPVNIPNVSYLSYCDANVGDVQCPIREFIFLSTYHRMPVTDGEIADVYHDPNPTDEKNITPTPILIDKATACELKSQEDKYEELEFWETLQDGHTVPIRCDNWSATNTVLDEDY